MCSAAERILRSGHTAILDAAFLTKAQRARAIEIADRTACATILIELQAPPDVLETRLRDRAASAQDPSEANIAVLEHQYGIVEPVSDAEGAEVLTCTNSVDIDIDGLVIAIRKLRTKGNTANGTYD